MDVRLAHVSQISASWIAQEALADWEPTWSPELIHLPPGHQLILALKPLYNVSSEQDVSSHMADTLTYFPVEYSGELQMRVCLYESQSATVLSDWRGN